jgi:hypothetical protein
MTIYLLIITDNRGKQHVEPTRYEFRAQAEMHGREYERRVPGTRWEVREVETGMLGRLSTDRLTSGGG